MSATTATAERKDMYGRTTSDIVAKLEARV